MPRTNLCSRLVVTSTRWNTPFPSSGLSPARPRPVSPSIEPSGSSASSLGSACCDAVRPLLAFPALGSQAVGAATASCYRITTPRGMNGVPSKRPCERFQPATTWVTRIADASCRIPPLCPASWALQQVPEPARSRSTKNAPSQARGAFHQQVPPSLSDSRRPPTAWAATGSLGSSPKAQLPTCFHVPTRGALDPATGRLFAGAGGPHAACQLLQRSVPRAHH